VEVKALIGETRLGDKAAGAAKAVIMKEDKGSDHAGRQGWGRGKIIADQDPLH